MASCTNRRMLIKVGCALLAVGFVVLVLRWLPSLSRTPECPNPTQAKIPHIHVSDDVTTPPVAVLSSTGADLPLPRVKAVTLASTPSAIEDKFTVVMQSYKRDDLLHRLLKHYCKISLIDRIIIVWNNVNVPVPDFLRNMGCGRERFFLRQSHNTIRNRFQPFPQIRTEGEPRPFA